MNKSKGNSRNNYRTAAFILCISLAFTACITACSKQNASVTSNPLTSGTEEKRKYLDSIPEGTDFGGKKIRVRINECDQTQLNSQIFMMGPTEEDGDVVNDAVLDRNRTVEERIGVKFAYDIVSYQWNQIVAPTRTLILSGDDVYDLIIDQQSSLLQIASENMLYNFFDCSANDFTQDYWWNSYMEELQIGSDARYIVAGDYFLDVVEVASAIFFNKQMFGDYYGSADKLYGLAFDGKWTVDALGAYIKDFYKDVTANSVADIGDTFSMNLSRNSMDAQCFGSGIDFMTRGGDGFPALNLSDPRISGLMQKLVDNYFTPNTTFDFRKEDSNISEAQYYKNQRTAFANRELLFLNDYIAAVKDLRDMQDDYGILPIPKLDEKIENYRSVPHDTALIGVIPTTCQIPETVCIVLEALCSMSHDTTMKTYFNTALKVKYTRDEKSSEIIDLLHDSITSSFCYAMTAKLNNYMEVFRTLYDSKSANYASELAKRETSINQMLDDMIEVYKSGK